MYTHPQTSRYSRRAFRARMLLWAALISTLPMLSSTSNAGSVLFPTIPLATSAGTAHPNLMFMLDDSFSMSWDFLPDNIHNTATVFTYNSTPTFSGTFASCFDTGDSVYGPSTTILDNPLPCLVGDPPYMSPDINRVYYDPSVYYAPPLRADGTRYSDQTNAAAVETDPYGRQQFDQRGVSRTTIDITTQYPDRAWCTGPADPATGSSCVINGSSSLTTTAYQYPDAIYGSGLDTLNLEKYRTGSPYYYQMLPTRYCESEDLRDVWSDGTPGHCVDATAPTGVYVFPALVQWCRYTGTSGTTIDFSQVKFNDCQAKNVGDYTYPRYLGRVLPGAPGTAARAKITVQSGIASYQNISSINLSPLTGSGTNIINTNLTGYSTSTAAATAIATAINNTVAPSGKWEFIACAGSGSTGVGCDQSPFQYHLTSAVASTVLPEEVYVFPATPNASFPSAQPYAPVTGTYPGIHEDTSDTSTPSEMLIVSGSSTTAATSSIATLTVCPGTSCATATGATPVVVYAVNINGTNILSSGTNVPNPGYAALAATSNQDAFATDIATAIQSNSGTSGYTASTSGNVVTITRTATGTFTGTLAVTASNMSGSTVTFPTATFTIPSTGTNGYPTAINNVYVDGVGLITPANPVWATSGLTSAANQQAAATALCSALTSAAGSNFTVTCPGGTAPGGAVASSTQVIVTGTASHPVAFTSGNTYATYVNNFDLISIGSSSSTLPVAVGVTSATVPISPIQAVPAYTSTQVLASSGTPMSTNLGWDTLAKRTSFASQLAGGLTAITGVTPTWNSGTGVYLSSTTKYFSTTNDPAVTASYFTGQLAAVNTAAGPMSISTINVTIGGSTYNALTSTVTIPQGQTAAQAAALIKAKVGGTSPAFTAYVSGSTVYIYEDVTNPRQITAIGSGSGVPYTPLYGTITLPATPDPLTTPVTVSSVLVNGLQALASPPLVIAAGTTRANAATAIAAAMTANGVVATASGGVIRVTIPAGATFTPITSLTASASAGSFATLTASANGPIATTITAINDGATNILGSNTVSVAANASANTVAAAINAAISAGGYTASVASNVVTVTKSGTFTSLTPVMSSSSYGTIAISAAPSDKSVVLTGITVNGTNLLSLAGGDRYYAPSTSAASIATDLAAVLNGIGGFTVQASGANLIVSKSGTTISTASGAQVYRYGDITFTATSSEPEYLTALTVNGTNVLTSSPILIPANSTAASIATLVQPYIGNGYAGVLSGTNTINIYSTSGAVISSGPSATMQMPYTTDINVGTWNYGTATITNFTVNGTNYGSASGTTPAALATSVIGLVGSTPSTTNYWATSPSSGVVRIHSPYLTSAPAAVTYGFTPPPAVAGVHAAASFSIAGGEVTFSSTTISNISIVSGGSCTSPTATNLLSGTTASATGTSALLTNVMNKDSGSDAFTFSLSSNTLTITENSSGTSWGNLNGCTLQITNNTSGSNPPVITTTSFSGGVNPNSSTAPSGGSFGTTTPPGATTNRTTNSSSLTGTAYSSSLTVNTSISNGTYTLATNIPTVANLAVAVGGAIPVTYTRATTGNLTTTLSPNSTTTPGYIGTSNFAGGVNVAGTIATTISTFSGSIIGSNPIRDKVGNFQRVNISNTCSSTDLTCFGRSVGTTSKFSARSDCAASSGCTYAEEVQNFSNWYAYYRTRMQAMKSGVGIAFNPLGGAYRVGFMTIHPDNSATSYLPLSEFGTTQKSSWYSDLYGAEPATATGYTETPLRAALSTVGRLFAGQKPLTGRTDGGGDPMQYACQQNFVLMTTDGYWREEDETKITKIDGTTKIADQDGAASPPFYDGDQTVGASTISTCPLGSGNAACQAHAATECSGASTTTNTSIYKSCNTLADVSYYYFNTDIRTGTAGTGTCLGGPVPVSSSATASFDVCTNLTTTGTAQPQRMTTFTVGLGVDGLLKYQDNYSTALSGDYYNILNGTQVWPQVKWNDNTGVDDLWHAAVNGGGTYFSAKTPSVLQQGISNAIATINKTTGAGTGVALESQTLTSGGSNLAFQPTYTTVAWYGNLVAYSLDASTGLPANTAWCASTLFDSAGVPTCTGRFSTQIQTSGASSRNIYMVDATTPASPTLKSFAWASMTAAERAYFDTTQLGQYSTYSSAQRNTLTTGTNQLLVDYLRGDPTYEQGATLSANQLFRTRAVSALGDIINSKPVYVAGAYFSYADPGYGSFAATVATRSPTIYIGANDGMLHAFNATSGASGGSERWAFVPSAMLPSMYTLANQDYGKANDPLTNDPNNHRSFVDGPVAVADICESGCTSNSTASWKTILVGSYGTGARGYYALDVTNPASPTVLWEFTTTPVSLGGSAIRGDADVGYATGQAVITKDGSGAWVVLVASGYNNSNGSTSTNGDGQGYLYVLNPMTGAVLKKIGTGAGAPATPSGFAKFSAWVDAPSVNNTTRYVYGGDLLGNLWRFDINTTSGTVVKIAELSDPSGVAQPITTRPELGLYGDRIVLVGTGKFMEQVDLTTTQVQTIYGIVDKYDSIAGLTAPAQAAAGGLTLTVPHTTSSSNMVQQTLSFVDSSGAVVTSASGAVARTATANTVDLSLKRGWFVDLPESGERVNVNPLLISGVLGVPSTVPVPDGCSPGHSWYTFIDYRTGGAANGTGLASALYATTIIVDQTLISNTAGTAAVLTQSNAALALSPVIPASGGGGLVTGRRSGWREIVE